jgi:lipid II:glycine glycyltransferase (peptidoglycan interpeptide bridge formation enzyme)
MKTEVTGKLQGSSAEEYEHLVSSSKPAMFYHSLRYLRLLENLIGADPIIVTCYDKGGRIAGALPAFIKGNTDTGTVLNSLPFFGSHGGVVVSEETESRIGDIYASILQCLKEEICPGKNVVASTIISSPFDKGVEYYKNVLSPQYCENRISQIVRMPGVETQDQLMLTFEKRCRWAIKKALQSHVLVRSLNEFEGRMLEQIYDMHVENMQKTGAPAKPRDFFEKLSEFFEIGQDYDVYVAEYDNNVIAALLIFYFGEFVEYFLPAVQPEFRNLNPMNLVVLRAMTNAIRRGFKFWNFGGTRETMSGVYMFKRSFGAVDCGYGYFTSILSDVSRLLDLAPPEMRRAYEWFYVIPYAVLRK